MNTAETTTNNDTEAPNDDESRDNPSTPFDTNELSRNNASVTNKPTTGKQRRRSPRLLQNTQPQTTDPYQPNDPEPSRLHAATHSHTSSSITRPRNDITTTTTQTNNASDTTQTDNASDTTNKTTTSNSNQKGATDTATTTNHKDLSNTTAKDGYAATLEDEVQCLVGGTSEKFVPEPMGEDITTDLINGLRRFKDAVRWKVYFKLLQESTKDCLN